jgi:LemA protein
MFIYILLGIIVLLVLWAAFSYNSFIRLINRTKEAWADIDVQLKRRYDLIPNLVNTVKGYASHEQGTLDKITEARTRAMSAPNVEEKGKAENVLSGTLKTLFAVSENYPDLKANQNFLELQKELSDTENKIQASRRFYNTNVMSLNTQVESFPSNFIAKIFNFDKADFFEIEEAVQRENVEVKF